MNRIVITSTVQGDGSLHLTLPLDSGGAETVVRVTIEPTGLPGVSHEEWQRCILETAGKWQGDFVRPEQGEDEQRAPLS